jgi:hypothetical protein
MEIMLSALTQLTEINQLLCETARYVCEDDLIVAFGLPRRAGTPTPAYTDPTGNITFRQVLGIVIMIVGIVVRGMDGGKTALIRVLGVIMIVREEINTTIIPPEFTEQP